MILYDIIYVWYDRIWHQSQYGMIQYNTAEYDTIWCEVRGWSGIYRSMTTLRKILSFFVHNSAHWFIILSAFAATFDDLPIPALKIQYQMVWYDLISLDLLQYNITIWFDLIQYNMIRHDST